MNTLIARGAEKSRCLLRTSIKSSALSTSAGASSPRSDVSARNQPHMMHATTSSASAGNCYTNIQPFSANTSSWTRNFSSEAPSQQQQQQRPSAIEKANPPLLTPGHAIRILQIHGANQAQLIRRSDFVKLCESSRPGKKRDAKVIATALREFKRNNKFVLHREGASAAVVGMMRSSIPNYKVVYGKPRVEAAVFVAEQVLDESTGLYFAVKIEDVDGVLSELQQGLSELEERGMNVRLAAPNEEDVEESGDECKMLQDAQRVTEGLMKLLVKRRSRPENKMKKRAKRGYLKLLQLNDGPEDSTLKLATQIALAIGGSASARKNIIAPYADAFWSGEVDESILQLVADAEAKELTEKESVEAAAAAAAAAAAEEEEASEVHDGSENDSEQSEESTEETKS
eukprot:scaffold97_cov193-Alexandrium_tamarense.AAC.22